MHDQYAGNPAGREYVLMTAAHNEGEFIEQTIRSVASQTVLPKRWVIVIDGSTDGTDSIVQGCAERLPFITRIILRPHGDRSFARQVNALWVAHEALRNLGYNFIGNVDADISLESNYFGTLLTEFERDPQLGLAGGLVYEKQRGEFRHRPFNTIHSVAQAAQLFRRACYEAVGGYVALPYGGADSLAEIRARSLGWHVRSIPELAVFHHRPTGSAGGLLRTRFRMGLMDYSLGYYPIFEFLKCVRRVSERPFLIGATARLVGFLSGYIGSKTRPVATEVIDFVRNEQKERLKSLAFTPFGKH